MSHAEAFAQLRSFVVGLEIKARGVRKVLETSREDGKWVNGKDGTGVGQRCARAIGAARPEQVTQEMVAEVAEQDKILRQAEDIVRADKSIEEATEKYQALVEYNHLALEDLEERLSAYGYVRPARAATLDHGNAEGVPPPVASIPTRLPERAAKTCGRLITQDGGHHKSEAKSSGGGGGGSGSGAILAERFGAAGGGGLMEAERADVDSSFLQQEHQRRHQQREGEDGGGDGLEAGSPTAATVGTSDGAAGRDAGYGGGGDQGDDPSAGAETKATTYQRRTDKTQHGEEYEEEEEEFVAAEECVSGRGAVTPGRPALGVREEPQQGQEPASPPTPQSPGLADWEITEGARAMLRRAQPHHEQEREEEEEEDAVRSDSSSVAAAAPRSLEALLAENTSLSAAGAFPGGGGGGRRSSVSSDWSPPPTTAGVGQSSGSTGGRQRRRRFGDDDDGSSGSRTGASGARARSAERGDPETAAAAEMAPTVAGDEGVGMETHSCGSSNSSNPPTPARMDFEVEERPLTPAGDRNASLGKPSPGCTSSLKNGAATNLAETALGCEERSDASAPRERDGSSVRSATPPARRTDQVEHGLPQGGGAAPPVGGVLTGPQGDFRGTGSSPESSVVAASRERTSEVSAPRSPETPATPEMLSPHLRIESAGGGGGGGGDGGPLGGADDGGYAADGTGPSSSGSVTRPVNRRLPLTPAAADSDGICANSGDDYDSDKCPTPELSSPLRSANISVRDLQVLTPSAKMNDGGGCGEYGRRNSADGRYGDDPDELCDSDQCPTPELSSPLRSTNLFPGSIGSAALCRRRLDEAGGGGEADDGETGLSASGGPLELVSEEEYARAPKFLTIQVSRSLLNETIGNLNAYAAPRLASPSELLLTVDEIMEIIDQGDLSRTLLLSAAHLKRIEMKGARMYRIRA